MKETKLKDCKARLMDGSGLDRRRRPSFSFFLSPSCWEINETRTEKRRRRTDHHHYHTNRLVYQ
jgi:hypothetical protein